MFNAVKSFKGLIKVKEVNVDNYIFKVHCKLTALILALFSVVVTMDMFFGKPIECFTSHKEEVRDRVLNTYCWMHSTFTLPKAYDKEIGAEVLAPGVDNELPGDDKIYHAYYQWVTFFLFLAAVLFYLPRCVWRSIEGQKIAKILLGLNCHIPETADKKDASVHKLAEYLKRSSGRNACYAFGFAVCELLNLINVVGQIYLTDAFLGGEFTTYGTDVLEFTRMEQGNRTDPMIRVFPRLTKCTFYKYGVSGSIQNHAALCVLTINIINEKIFIFLWFWYLIVAAVSIAGLLIRVLLMASSRVRLYVARCRCRYADRMLMENVVLDYMGNYGDWFVLNLLEKNLNPMHFCDLIKEIDRLMGEHDERIMLKSMNNGYDTSNDIDVYEKGGTIKQGMIQRFVPI